MKRFDFDTNNAHIVNISSENNASSPQKSSTTTGFDIVKLLQILPKLNLNGLLGGQNNQTNLSNSPQSTQNFSTQAEFAGGLNDEFTATQNLMSQHNVALAKSTLETHANLVNKLRDN